MTTSEVPPSVVVMNTVWLEPSATPSTSIFSGSSSCRTVPVTCPDAAARAAVRAVRNTSATVGPAGTVGRRGRRWVVRTWCREPVTLGLVDAFPGWSSAEHPDTPMHARRAVMAATRRHPVLGTAFSPSRRGPPS